MMKKIQKFGGAMFTPVLLFAFAGLIIGLGTLFTTEAIFGDLTQEGTIWHGIWNMILQGGWTVFNQLPLLFAISLPIGMAKKQNARCCMESFVLYLTFHYFLNAILTQWGGAFGVDFSQEIGGSGGLTMIANIKTLDIGMVGALIVSGIVIYLHNKYFDTELPEWLGTFNGSIFVVMIGFFVMIPIAFIFAFIWPKVQQGMFGFQGFIKSAGALGVWVFVFLERILIPFGLHHLLYAPFFYDNVLVSGGIFSHWAKMLPEMAATTKPIIEMVPEAAFTSTGFSKIFGCLGIALAFYATANEDKKKEVLGLLIPITLTAIVSGITEPIEFTFLFIAPVLFVVHSLLAATLSTVMYLGGVVGIHSGGAIEMASLNWIPLMANHWPEYLKLLVIGLVFTVIWYIVFKTLILKFNFRTPGREDKEIKFRSKNEFRNKDKSTLAMNILKGLGGKDNIEEVTNCATRLRVNVKEPSLCQNDEYFKSIGAHGCSSKGNIFQVIVGLRVASIREDFEDLL